jgi:hypothetical protein
MNEIEKLQQSSIAVANKAKAFTTYGEAQNQRAIIGQLLKFSKGDFLAGQDEKEVPEGTELIANMDELLAGWVRWQDNKPTDHVMGKVSDGYQPPRRNELGDDDREQWEVDAAGQPRDPWQFSNYLLLKGTGEYSSVLYTFTTSSRGGLNALGELCKAYGGAMAQHQYEYPVIALGINAYDHPNRAFGRIKVPTFKIVGWAPETVFASNIEAIVKDEEPPPPKKAKGRY